MYGAGIAPCYVCPGLAGVAEPKAAIILVQPMSAFAAIINRFFQDIYFWHIFFCIDALIWMSFPLFLQAVSNFLVIYFFAFQLLQMSAFRAIFECGPWMGGDKLVAASTAGENDFNDFFFMDRAAINKRIVGDQFFDELI